MKKSYYVMIAALLLALVVIGKGFVLNEDIKIYVLIFFVVGNGLGLLRIFVNNSIKKMKGKPLALKILFFAVLLGFGLPFQSWFRNKVMFSMDSSYLPYTITMMVSGVIFMTIFFGFIKDKKKLKTINEEKNESEVA